jgi:ABC-type molybdate transport system substrate-binding protein
MTKLILFLLLLYPFSLMAYVPTIESLFRHGANPDVVASGVSITMVVKQKDIQNSTKELSRDFYKIFFNKSGDSLKVSQTKYNSDSFSESSLLHKIYFPNFTAYTIAPGPEFADKGIFYGALKSIVFNNGIIFINYLKSMGVPVRLNNELINREKIEFLAEYKRYLAKIKKDRNAKKNEVNPMQPNDPVARERAKELILMSMYTDTKQVEITKTENGVFWLVRAGAFEAMFSYKERDLAWLKFSTGSGDIEVHYKDYWVANGTHRFPRHIHIKTASSQLYEIEVTNLRHFVEREDDLMRRLKNWDQILKSKNSQEPRAEFLL